jgi:(2Fe-2S) ferredoxin
MGKFKSVELEEFCFQGRLLDFVLEDGYQLKGLRLATDDGECYVKLARHLRAAFNLQLPLGTCLQVMGTKKYHPKKNIVTLKAEQVILAASNNLKIKPSQNPAVILICQKSDCAARGSRLLCKALETELSDRNLADTVMIKSTGCMKNCKSGPNLVMPDKTRYSQILSAQVPALIEKHFIAGKSFV